MVNGEEGSAGVRESTMGGGTNDGGDSTHASLAERGIPQLASGCTVPWAPNPTERMKKYSCYNDGVMRERNTLMETQETGLECCTLKKLRQGLAMHGGLSPY